MTTSNQAVVAAAITQGNTALSSFSTIQRNRGNRFALDLSSATVIQVLQAYEAKQKKAKPNYSMHTVIRIIEDIEKSERIAAETTIMPDGSRAEWAGPFMPLDVCADFWVAFEAFYIHQASTAKNATPPVAKPTPTSSSLPWHGARPTA